MKRVERVEAKRVEAKGVEAKRVEARKRGSEEARKPVKRRHE